MSESQRFGLRPKEAAKSLGIGLTRFLDLVRQGRIRSVRVGRAIIVPVDALRDFLAAAQNGGAQ